VVLHVQCKDIGGYSSIGISYHSIWCLFTNAVEELMFLYSDKILYPDTEECRPC